MRPNWLARHLDLAPSCATAHCAASRQRPFWREAVRRVDGRRPALGEVRQSRPGARRIAGGTSRSRVASRRTRLTTCAPNRPRPIGLRPLGRVLIAIVATELADRVSRKNFNTTCKKSQENRTWRSDMHFCCMDLSFSKRSWAISAKAACRSTSSVDFVSRFNSSWLSKAYTKRSDSETQKIKVSKFTWHSFNDLSCCRLKSINSLWTASSLALNVPSSVAGLGLLARDHLLDGWSQEAVEKRNESPAINRSPERSSFENKGFSIQTNDHFLNGTDSNWRQLDFPSIDKLD